MFGRKVRALVSAASPSARAAARLKARARTHREAGRFAAAAVLLEEALRARPQEARLRIQAGHMRKEARQLAEAETHYLTALQQLPDDADLALQLGHFYKIAGRADDAEVHYQRAAALNPGWEEAERELAALRQDHGTTGGMPPHIALMMPAFRKELPDLRNEREGLARAATLDQLVADLVPRRFEDLLHEHAEVIDVRRLGRKENSFWGLRRTLRGVEAVRGFCISTKPIVEMQILLNGLAIHRGSVKGPYILKFEHDKERCGKYVFNEWLDFDRFARGLHAIELRFTDADGDTHSFHDHVVIADPMTEADLPRSDSLVSLAPDDSRTVEEQVRARPSMVRPAKRDRFPDGIRNVLVLRTDQLGDMVASIPAMQRLRELVPEARIVGLLTGANADFARTLGLFDDVIVIDFPDDVTERRRLMPLDAQEELRERLAAFEFDVAIDLAQAAVSRKLLQLAGAKFTFGTMVDDTIRLSGEFAFNTPDRWNAMDTTPHSTKVLALIEAFGTILKTSAPIIRRDDLARDLLEPYGIGSDVRYVVLHTGARVEFSRWPAFPELAAMLLRETDLKVVMMTEDPAVRATLPAELLASDRFLFVDQRLSFDLFDAFVSFATVLVGNDSGPKHLASLRGVPAVTLFTARINWTEWGQENVGSIISRKVPCAGCAIFHDHEECGKDFACIRDIRPQEVFETVMSHVG